MQAHAHRLQALPPAARPGSGTHPRQAQAQAQRQPAPLSEVRLRWGRRRRRC